MPISDAGFRAKLRQARKQAGLTQVELAKKLKKPQSYVSKYEKGERRLDVLELIAVLKAIETDVIDFIRQMI